MAFVLQFHEVLSFWRKKEKEESELKSKEESELKSKENGYVQNLKTRYSLQEFDC